MINKEYPKSENATGWFVIEEKERKNDGEYLAGIDYYWIAMDQDGYLGVFNTSGYGEIPIQALAEDMIPIWDVPEVLCEQLPIVSEVNLLAEPFSQLYIDKLTGFASRGLFVYEWSWDHRKYELAAYPVNPITKESLDGALLKLAEVAVINFPLFSLKKSFSSEGFLKCVYPSDDGPLYDKIGR